MFEGFPAMLMMGIGLGVAMVAVVTAYSIAHIAKEERRERRWLGRSR